MNGRCHRFCSKNVCADSDFIVQIVWSSDSEGQNLAGCETIVKNAREIVLEEYRSEREYSFGRLHERGIRKETIVLGGARSDRGLFKKSEN